MAYYTVMFVLQANVADLCGTRWVSVFSDDAEKLIGKAADEIAEIYDNSKKEGAAVLNKIRFNRHIFKLRPNKQTYGSKVFNRLAAKSISRISHQEYNQQLIKSLNELMINK